LHIGKKKRNIFADGSHLPLPTVGEADLRSRPSAGTPGSFLRKQESRPPLPWWERPAKAATARERHAG